MEYWNPPILWKKMVKMILYVTFGGKVDLSVLVRLNCPESYVSFVIWDQFCSLGSRPKLEWIVKEVMSALTHVFSVSCLASMTKWTCLSIPFWPTSLCLIPCCSLIIPFPTHQNWPVLSTILSVCHSASTSLGLAAFHWDNSEVLKSGMSEFEPWFCHLLAVWP